MTTAASLHTDAPPEAMADVPGVCELPLTRAVVQYRDVHEVDLAGGRIQDIGLALVLEGRYASSAEVVDLGSADVKVLDLSAELVVLDWVYEPTLEHAHALLRTAASPGGAPAGTHGSAAERGDPERADRRELERFCFRVGLRVLERVGFGPLTRPSMLRIGFRDICRDLDLHEGTSVRISAGAGRLLRAHLDYDGNAMVFRTGSPGADAELEEALTAAFPTGDLRHPVEAKTPGSAAYQVRFPLPLSLDETREELEAIRTGLAHLLARFEPDRFRSVEEVVATFGRRETLARLHVRSPRTRYARVDRSEPPTPPAAGRTTVH